MKRKALITLILGTALAVAPTAGAVVLSDGGGGGAGSAAAVPSAVDPATQAVILRSEEMSSYYTANPVVDPATQAVLDRSKALGDYYGANGVTLHTDVLGGNGGSSATPISTDGDSFNWSPILASTLAGMVLLAFAATAMTRRRHSLSF